MFTRNLAKPLQRKHSFFLFGPRGTGKTTWLKDQIPNAITIDLLDKSIYRELLAQPERLTSLIPPETKNWIIIDEIQKIPELLDVVHRLIENNKYLFILTGSSARSLRKHGVNHLAGRAHTYHLYPLTTNELGETYNFDIALKNGFLPTVWNNIEAAEYYLKSYITTYLTEEVLQEGLSRNLSTFSSFLEIASFSQGSLLNVSHIARECGVDRKTADNYFSILEDMLLAYRLSVFTRRAKRELVAQGKFYYFDVGIFRALRPRGPLDVDAEINGISIETMVLQEIISNNAYNDAGFSLHFWRTTRGAEVDFILYGPKGLYAIEVKASARIYKASLAGIRLFKSDYPEATCVLFYAGSRKEYHESITVLPLSELSTWLLTIMGA